MIRNKTAQRLCNDWHTGQWSSLYQFASTGTWILANHLLYLQEIQQAIEQPKFALRPYDHKVGNRKDLINLREYFEKRGNEAGPRTLWRRHETYGYWMPFLHWDVPGELANIVTKPTYIV